MTQQDDVVADLRRRYDGLTNSQKRIAEAIVEDPEFVAFATVDKLGARLGVSPSTIVRFSYRLGLDGYQDLQKRVQESVRQQIRSGADAGNSGSVVQHLGDSAVAESISHDLENVHRTLAEVSLETISAAVELLQNARRIYVVGHMASDSPACFAALALERLHGNTFQVRVDGMLAPMLYEASKEDVFLVLSFPPYATHTLAVVNVAVAKRASVIAITDSFISPISQRADVVLTAHVSGLSTQNSLVAPLVLVNMLLNGVAAGSPDALARHRDVIGAMASWDSFVLENDEPPDVKG